METTYPALDTDETQNTRWEAVVVRVGNSRDSELWMHTNSEREHEMTGPVDIHLLDRA